MPGDDVVEAAQVTVTHATTLPVPPEDVWPWIVQMGWGRGGWYTARVVDRLLFPANGPSADRILPEHQVLRVGDRVPDGPPDAECSFTVVEVQEGRRLVLRSDSHLPLSWRRRGLAGVEWTWAFELRRVHADGRVRTRLVFRWRARTRPSWFTVLVRLLVVPADLAMSRSMLHGLRRRVTGSHRRRRLLPLGLGHHVG
jgi:hypothetical protein